MPNRFSPVIRVSMLAAACAVVVALDVSSGDARVVAPAAAQSSSRPFAVGERLTYDAKVNFLHAGSATMSVESIEAVHGKPAHHTIFDLSGGRATY